ncbi:AAA domain-containing protein [Pontibacter mucosus]|uniref:AAA domain-containing protein n=1 Tax=Pontibacter mucosus TaxID=1649266 RepID=A0A2T5YQI7_9BACT|nr:AAA family ATPase [Pontibacter mucosus]PTX21551.1 AAA domain-containing protein [Pontibacter mucosus]
MINSIDRIKCLGIFKDYVVDSSTEDFSKYNLIYGWNGSGKTTLSKLFAFLEKKKDISPSYSDCEFKISTSLGVVDQTNYKDSSLSVKVFNEDFIKDNIDWNNVVKSLLLVSEEKIKDRDELNKKKQEKVKYDVLIDSLKKDHQILSNNIEAFLSSTAKSIKEKFRIIDTSDKYYFNYDKAKLRSFINSNLKVQEIQSLLMSEEDLNAVSTSIKPDVLDYIKEVNLEIDFLLIEEANKKINSLLKTNIVSKTIEHLLLHSEISEWVEKGLQIHTEYNKSICEFCGCEVKPERIENLNNHFNKDYKEIKIKIEAAIKWLNESKISSESFFDEHILYPELRKEYLEIRSNTFDLIEKINNVLNQWIHSLETKRENPFDEVAEVDLLSKDLIESYGNCAKTINQLIKKHNCKTENFEEELKVLKQKLETHYAAVAVQDFNFFIT